MAGIDGHALWRLADVLKSAMPAPKQTDRATARLSYVDDEGIGWYRIEGSSIDTPCVGGEVADVQPGEQVEVEIRGGMLYVTGNDDSPSVGEGRVTSIASGIVEPVRVRVVQAIEENAVTKAIADAAKRVADAIDQHFWTDTNGVHVTHATQDDWETNHSGPNVLINSVGQLFRDGLNNLVTITTENNARAISFFDGLGNNAANIMAYFGSDGARIGYTSGNRVEVTANGFLIYLGQALMAAFMADAVKFYDGLGAALTNIIAQFGATGSRVGYSNGYHVDMNSGGIDLYNADVNRTVNINNDVTLISNDYGGGIDFCPDSTLGVATLEGAVSQRTLHTTPMAMEQMYTKVGTSVALVRLRTQGTAGASSSDITISVSRDASTDTSYYLTFDPLNGLRLYAPLYTHENIHTDGSTIYVDNGQSETRTYLQAVEGEDYNTTRLGTHRESYGVDIYNNLNLTIDDEGNRSVGVSEVAPWLRTFGLDGTGDLLTANPSAVSVATSSWSTLGSITVTQGIWVFSISTTFASNNSGRRAVYFGNSSTGTSITVGAMGGSIMAPADGGMTKYSNCHIGNVTSANGDTYYCRAWQNSGSSLSCQCYLRAVRIV